MIESLKTWLNTGLKTDDGNSICNHLLFHFVFVVTKGQKVLKGIMKKKTNKKAPFPQYIKSISKQLGSKATLKAIDDCLILLKAMNDHEPDPVTIDFIERVSRFKNLVSNLKGLEELVKAGKYADTEAINAVYQKVQEYQKNVITKVVTR